MNNKILVDVLSNFDSVTGYRVRYLTVNRFYNVYIYILNYTCLN